MGISTLATGLRSLGTEVRWFTPTVPLPSYTARQWFFNQTLRLRKFSNFDATIGMDLDGYTISRQSPVPHIAAIKGVLADAVPFESGATRVMMSFQARCEAVHARRAHSIVTDSRYCADRIVQLYGAANPIAVVPEPIDLASWRDLFAKNPAREEPARFVVLCVCRFYARKRVDVLLRAAALLRSRIPTLEVRIVGGGPSAPGLIALARDLGLEATVKWVGDASRAQLAREYNNADVFCLPSVQEGFGIVFLEAMAAGKPIVAIRSAAIPEVVRNGLLAEPGNEHSLCEAIGRLYADPDLRHALGDAGQRQVEEYDVGRVSRLFLGEVERSVNSWRRGSD